MDYVSKMSVGFEVFKFDKPYDFRRAEYEEILFTDYEIQKTLPGEMKDLWVTYLKTTVEPKGWSALWKLQKNLCEQYLVYPNTVLFVMVDQVDFDKFTADLTVLQQNESVDKGAKFYNKPLKDLYPTTSQENGSLAVLNTAERIDQLRIFYEYLWRPWDPLVVCNDWRFVYLDKRLAAYNHLFVEKKIAESPIALCAQSLIIKGNKLFTLMDNVGSISYLKANRYEQTGLWRCMTSEGERMNPTVVQIKYKNELGQLIANIHGFEMGNKLPCITGSSIIIVMKPPSNDEDYIKHTQEIPELRTSENWEIVEHFPVCTAECDRSIIIVNDAIYYMYDLTCLTYGGSLRGLYDDLLPTIADLDFDTCLCDLYGKQTMLSNLVFSTDNCKEVITIHSGCSLSMLNVRMRHGNPLGTCGIVVQNNATLVADGCNFKGFGIAIMAFPKSHVELNGCIFQDNEIGVKAFEGSEVRFTETDPSVMKSADAEPLLSLLEFNFISYPYVDSGDADNAGNAAGN